MNFAFGGTGVFETLNQGPRMTTQISFFEKAIQDKVFITSNIRKSVALVSIAGNDYTFYNFKNGSIQGISPCQLYLSSPTYRMVGKGKVHNTSGELLHHNPLPVGYMKVSVDLVLDTDALLPLPDVVSETTLMREAVRSFVGWPSDLIFPDAETPTRPTHKAGKGISRRIESVASLKEVPGRKLKKAGNDIPPTTSGTKSQIMMRLEKMVNESDIMHGAIRSIDFDEGVFGAAHFEIIAKEDMQQLFEHDELGIAVIHTYIWYMYLTLLRGTELCNRFNFIAASRINATLITKNPTSVKNDLVDRFMAAGDNTTPSLYFLPFNSGNGGHWVLVAMDLSRLIVYYLDSLSGDWSKYPSMKKTVDAAIIKFRSKKNYRNRKDITWIRVKCPQQNNSVDCGFFVLRFMRDIIALNRIDIPKMYFEEYKSYSRAHLDEMKDELCQFIVDQRII
ncbi:hypothetical protein KIW84_031358 [Lathyrus oleraceus]|uniref:Ubiquitin-like protease family profile domain-containing protein n=2 Tax=Pisum sativum TaxID=3888 RepID=A0A9D4XR03_PEA|nr:hypothetical protein KIW84_031358 [Pisum sativum]